MSEDLEEIIQFIDLDNPEFEIGRKTHNWKNYVPDEWIKEWDSLTERERKIIAVMAEIQAFQEDWE